MFPTKEWVDSSISKVAGVTKSHQCVKQVEDKGLSLGGFKSVIVEETNDKDCFVRDDVEAIDLMPNDNIVQCPKIISIRHTWLNYLDKHKNNYVNSLKLGEE